MAYYSQIWRCKNHLFSTEQKYYWERFIFENRGASDHDAHQSTSATYLTLPWPENNAVNNIILPFASFLN